MVCIDVEQNKAFGPYQEMEIAEYTYLSSSYSRYYDTGILRVNADLR